MNTSFPKACKASPRGGAVVKHQPPMQATWDFYPWDRKIPWRRKWQRTPVFLPGKSHGQRSLAGSSPWDSKELDMTERLHYTTLLASQCNSPLSLPRWHSGKESTFQSRKCRDTQVWSLDQEDPLEKEMATHSSILAWKIAWSEEPGGLQSMRWQRVGHNWATVHIQDMWVIFTVIILQT